MVLEVKVVSQIFLKRTVKISVPVLIFLSNLQIFVFLSWPTDMERREGAEAALWSRSVRGGREQHPGTTVITVATAKSGTKW